MGPQFDNIAVNYYTLRAKAILKDIIVNLQGNDHKPANL